MQKNISCDLSFVILTWNSDRYLGRCFGSIIAQCARESLNFEIIAIDNGSTDGTREILRKCAEEHPATFHFILLDRNMGTTGPRNMGLKKTAGKYICVLDSDTEFRQGSIRSLLEKLRDERIGIVAPKLLLADGSIQNSVKKFPTFLQKLSKIPKAAFGLPMPDFDYYEDLASEDEFFADCAISACWFLRREIVGDVGLLDENIFYSPEDLDFCMRIRKAGKKLLYYPALSFLHHTQQISHKKPFGMHALSHFKSIFYYYRKHGGWISVT